MLLLQFATCFDLESHHLEKVAQSTELKGWVLSFEEIKFL